MWDKSKKYRAKAIALTQKRRYGEAIRAYLKAGDSLEAAKLAEKMGNYEKAASIYESRPDRTKAVECYIRAGLYRDADRIAVEAKQSNHESAIESGLDKAIDQLTKTGNYQAALTALVRYAEYVDRISSFVFLLGGYHEGPDLQEGAWDAGLWEPLSRAYEAAFRTRFPENVQHWSWLPLIAFMKAGRVEAAVDMFIGRFCHPVLPNERFFDSREFTEEDGYKYLGAGYKVMWTTGSNACRFMSTHPTRSHIRLKAAIPNELIALSTTSQQFYDQCLARLAASSKPGLLYTCAKLGSGNSEWRPWPSCDREVQRSCTAALARAAPFLHWRVDEKFPLSKYGAPDTEALTLWSISELIELVQKSDGETPALEDVLIDALRERKTRWPLILGLAKFGRHKEGRELLSTLSPTSLWSTDHVDACKLNKRLDKLTRKLFGESEQPATMDHQTLERMFALGEISKEEYDRLKPAKGIKNNPDKKESG